MRAQQNQTRVDVLAAAPLFTPLELGGLTLRNRVAVAPMTRVSATEDGRATQQMAEYYSAFAAGGFGLVITEGTYTDRAFSQGYRFQPGLTDDAQRDAWSRVVEGVHRQGGRIFAQLMHAGALSQWNPYNSGTRGPSAVKPRGQQMTIYHGSGDYSLPEPLSQEEISVAIRGFANAAVRAREAGFDGVEIHGANGYLLDQFLTAGVNLRGDRYGGGIERRVRLIVEVVEAVRAAVGANFAVGVRISQGKVNDFTHKWSEGEPAAAVVFETLDSLPLDYIHTTEFEAWQPAFGAGLSLAALAKKYSRKPVLANGGLHAPAQAAGMIDRGEADFVSLGRGALMHPDWVRKVSGERAIEEFDRGLILPIADLENARRYVERMGRR
ncbi:oxidoreductase [Peristeroidobacter agariperforans]|uniref:oxidoreductase n=1 Tax=Peristeroidobacter agariperforans TaxID=268404 RepID=UPI00101BC84C|nr:NADH:flavin oxidoreductase [Peristeroidobacter agariperforans]